MTFEQFYSSSLGNLYMVAASNGKRLMIDPGVTWSKLQKALNYDLSNIVGCLVSHEHKDHSRAVKNVMRAGIDVFASKGTLDVVGIKNHRRGRAIPAHAGITNTVFDSYAFPTIHDAAEPFGFVIRCDNEYLLFATDTSHIKQRFGMSFSIIAIGVSYDKDILQKRVDTGDIHEEVAKRLLTSHMEKQVAMDYLSRFCDLSKCREIHLLHMSGDNINKAQTKKEFEKKFFIETRIVESANAPSKTNC